MNKTFLSIAALAVLALPTQGHADETIQIVGSSTVYPFVTVAAEQFGNKTGFNTPIVESTGTGGGFKLFCEGTGDENPDISNASRPIKQSETELCAQNGVTNITEIKIGFDGIVFANAKQSERYDLSKEHIFKALAKEVPVDGKLVANPYQKWGEIDSSLPDQKIEVYGPPTTSGTRDAFVELVMEPSCVDMAEFEAAYPDKKERAKMCQMMREDGAYIEAGENDNLIVQKLQSNPQAFGVFGYSFLEENGDTVQGSKISGMEPTFENISGGSYGVSRSLYVYVKEARIGKTKGLQEFVSELISDGAAGEYGYLSEKGLIPLPNTELVAMQGRVSSMVQSAAE